MFWISPCGATIVGLENKGFCEGALLNNLLAAFFECVPGERPQAESQATDSSGTPLHPRTQPRSPATTQIATKMPPNVHQDNLRRPPPSPPPPKPPKTPRCCYAPGTPQRAPPETMNFPAMLHHSCTFSEPQYAPGADNLPKTPRPARQDILKRPQDATRTPPCPRRPSEPPTRSQDVPRHP